MITYHTVIENDRKPGDKFLLVRRTHDTVKPLRVSEASIERLKKLAGKPILERKHWDCIEVKYQVDPYNLPKNKPVRSNSHSSNWETGQWMNRIEVVSSNYSGLPLFAKGD